jgi:hypothetical protein
MLTEPEAQIFRLLAARDHMRHRDRVTGDVTPAGGWAA